MGRLGALLALTALALASSGAQAHELACEKKVNGRRYVKLVFPKTGPKTHKVEWELTVRNVHHYLPSIAEYGKDKLLEELGFRFYPPFPYELPLHGKQTYRFEQTIHSYGECKALAKKDGWEDEFIDNVFTVKWDDGSDTCTARIECVLGERDEYPEEPENPEYPEEPENPEYPEEPENPEYPECPEHPGDPKDPDACAPTRSKGFFATHPDVMKKCLEKGDIDLGFLEVRNVKDALGLVWGSPAFFDDWKKREGLDKSRFLLARQTLVAICNERLFDADSHGLTYRAVEALAGRDCKAMDHLAGKVDAFNNSGSGIELPFRVGHAEPIKAMLLADDPTYPSGQTCQSSSGPYASDAAWTSGDGYGWGGKCRIPPKKDYCDERDDDHDDDDRPYCRHDGQDDGDCDHRYCDHRTCDHESVHDCRSCESGEECKACSPGNDGNDGDDGDDY